ncbi:MAG: glycogen debranching N-terminal domain-containing protein [Thermosynechococcus sp.]|uniref:amylo-alpha-1,6-glucosidase n=1 Tax=Thermosynechococcus sp. TaxID=2814275 RepID=UPI00391ABC1B
MQTDVVSLYGRDYIPIVAPPLPATKIQTHPKTVPVLKDDDVLLICDELGNICNGEQQTAITGLFCQDTRFLSQAELRVGGDRPVLLSFHCTGSHALKVVCTNPKQPNLPAEALSIERSLVIRGALFETLLVTNHQAVPASVTLSLSFASDFQDLFEIRQYGNPRLQRGQTLQPVCCDLRHAKGRADFCFAYQGLDGALMETQVQFLGTPPTYLEGMTAKWHLKLEPQGYHTIHYCVRPFTNGAATSRVPVPSSLATADRLAQEERQQWWSQCTEIVTSNPQWNRILRRGMADLYMLLQSFGHGKVLTAGIPWFATLFGRDSIIAAMQTLILNPAIARDTLCTLAHYQGKEVCPERDEQPGKILHELRFGEMARNREIPHTPYYGTVDATPLWLMLYADYYHWTGDRPTVERLWPHALAAMHWIDQQMAATGYLTYNRQAAKGIDNQGWKDSGNCIVNRRGQLAHGPIALCEVQGYVYAAKTRLSALARELGYGEWGDRWQNEAAALKDRFNRDFWLESEGFYALALDGDGRPVDSLTSNAGQCLMTGICDPEKAQRVGQRLRLPDLFNGWGIRTLSSTSPAYNPIGYHLGSVWPHDTSLIALGLRAIGDSDFALTLVETLFEMVCRQPDLRPPELFCGFDRHTYPQPVQYPVACSPQAWATGSLFQFIQIMVWPLVDASQGKFLVHQPLLPTSIEELHMRNLRVGDTHFHLRLWRTGEKGCDWEVHPA